MSEIQRYGSSHRWADIVVHRGVAHWVEVAEDATADARGQIEQVLAQIDATLTTIGSLFSDILLAALDPRIRLGARY